MISIDAQTQTSTSSTSNIVIPANEEEPTQSFSQLLKGVSGKKDAKIIQNGTIILALDDKPKNVLTNLETKETKKSSKSDTLASLLKGENAENSSAKEPLEINPKITASMSVKDVKNLVADAKEYLKSKILDSEGYKKSLVKELPQTLKGLATMAKSFGIDVSKITIQEVQAKTPADKLLATKEDKGTIQNSDRNEKTEKNLNTVKIENLPEKKSTHTSAHIVDTKSKIATDEKIPQNDVKESTQRADSLVKELKATPLFKAQTPTEHTTQQIVQTKASGLAKLDDKTTPKSKADETLKLLLRGDKPTNSNPALTTDFSVATARVIAPTATTESTKSLESLLHGDKNESAQNSSKLDGLTAHKADSFEVKLNEAKHMIKYLSNDVKTAIEDYKSPFTRVKVQLNPQKLGEVDITIIQRGKNLHVNLSSNNAAINTLSMNASELKTQLNNSGINNATLNFNNNSQNSEQNSNQQQNRQNEREAGKEYNYFNDEEQNEEILSSLEIIVPNYA